MPLPLAGRDHTAELLEGSRWMLPEQARARAAWFEALPLEHKERVLRRFEMLLKGLVCLGSPVNHPGPPRRGDPPADRPFDAELGAVRQAIASALDAGRALAGDERLALPLRRYLDSILPREGLRGGQARRAPPAGSPARNLALLLSALEDAGGIASALAAGPSVPFRAYAGLIRTAQREIHRSEHFDPLAALEFRSEFDRIRSPRLVELLSGIRLDPARRVATLVFLSLSRLLSLLELIEGEARPGGGAGALLAFAAAARSDGRALSIFLRRDAGGWLADGFGRLFESASPLGVFERYPRLAEQFEGLKSLRELLSSVGNQLRLELRKVFEQRFPAPERVLALEDPGPEILPATAALRGFLQNSVVLLAREFEPDLAGAEVFPDFVADRVRSERLRRDIWMFQQVLRAFGAKARSTADAADRWSGSGSLRFVREFVSYFKSMGYQLLRYSDYASFGEFLGMVERLRDGDVLDTGRLDGVIALCDEFNGYLEQMFESVSRRAELSGVPFDKRDAARTLKLFLGH